MARSRIWSNTAEFLSLESIHPEQMGALHAYWRNCAVDADVPRQKDLSIRDMPDCLEHIALLDIETEPFRAKYMIVGEALKELLGADPTDQYLDTVYPKSISDEIYRAFKRSMDERRALYFRREFQILMKSFGYNRLILPMRLNGDSIRRILICIYPLDKKLKRAEQWQSVVLELEEIDRREAQYETAWADSLGYKVETVDDDVFELSEDYLDRA